MDYLRQIFEERLAGVLEQARYEELGPADLKRIARSVELSLRSPKLAQGARDLLVVLSDESEEQDGEAGVELGPAEGG